MTQTSWGIYVNVYFGVLIGIILDFGGSGGGSLWQYPWVSFILSGSGPHTGCSIVQSFLVGEPSRIMVTSEKGQSLLMAAGSHWNAPVGNLLTSMLVRGPFHLWHFTYDISNSIENGIEALRLHSLWRSDHYKILHMPRQLCCRDMCKIL